MDGTKNIDIKYINQAKIRRTINGIVKNETLMTNESHLYWMNRTEMCYNMLRLPDKLNFIAKSPC